jgi:hypothetical protein
MLQQEAQAALAVVAANKTLPPSPLPSPEHPADAAPANKLLEQAQQHPHQRPASASNIVSRTASPARFDKFGRRVISPPLTRTSSGQGTPGTSTPLRRESEVSLHSAQIPFQRQFTEFFQQHQQQLDLDVAQATSLMQLYEIRAKIKQQDNSSLLKAREKISALRQFQSQNPITPAEGHATPDVKENRYTYPRTSAP